MLAMNIVSAVAAGVGIVFAAIATAVERLPGVWGRDSMCSYASLNPEEIRICHETIAVPYVSVHLVRAGCGRIIQTEHERGMDGFLPLDF